MNLTPDEYVQAFFAIFALGSMALFLGLGGVLVEWNLKRKEKNDDTRRSL